MDVKAKDTDMTYCPCELIALHGERGLSVVFYEKEAELVRKFAEYCKFCGVAKEISNDDRPSICCNDTLDYLGVKTKCDWIDITKYRSCT